MEATNECDVLIIGGGLAGSCLARQLRLEQPDLSIIQIDKKTTFDWWVGESSIEVFDDYVTRVLKLGSYMMSRHITKHGLRFFFDTPEKDLTLEQMSEVGRGRYGQMMPAYQIDRAAFDADLCRMNAEMGVDVRLGTAVLPASTNEPSIVVDGKQGHVVRTSSGVIRCRWLIDAGGRQSPLAQTLGLVKNANESSVGSYWVRVKNFRNLDELGSQAWRARVAHTQRYLSTNHFMYKGYWIWHIPVSHEILSIGVTFDRDIAPLAIKSAADLMAFFRSHKSLDEILPEQTEVLDFMGLKHVPRCAEQFCSTDRWFLTGMAGLFVDPIFSTNCSVISVSNRFVAAAIEAERSGDQQKLANRIRHFNVILPTMYRALSAGVKYHRFGSFDACAAYLFQRFQSYLNTELPNQVTDHRRTLEFIDSHAEGCSCSRENAWKNFQAGMVGATDRMTDEFIQFLEERGLYHARNQGYFIEGTARLSLLDRAWHGDIERDVQVEENRTTYEASFRYFVGRMLATEGKTWREAAFLRIFRRDFGSGQTLSEVWRAMSDVTDNAGIVSPSDPSIIGWTPKGPITRAQQEVAPWHGVFTGPAGESEVLNVAPEPR